jgi:cytochrome c-type biogenesis protein CcmF
MIVHLGVVIVAVGLAAATAYGHRATFQLAVGESVTYEGQRITYGGAAPFSQPNRSGIVGLVYVDGAAFRPAISNYTGYEGIATPAIDSSWRRDVYLTISAVSGSGKGPASIGVVEQPMVLWLWVGGVLTAFGALLAAVPSGRRRRSEREGESAEAAPAAAVAGGTMPARADGSAGSADAGRGGGAGEADRPHRLPVGVGE